MMHNQAKQAFALQKCTEMPVMQNSSVPHRTSQVKSGYKRSPKFSDDAFGFPYRAAHTLAVPATACCCVSLLVSLAPNGEV